MTEVIRCGRPRCSGGQGWQARLAPRRMTDRWILEGVKNWHPAVHSTGGVVEDGGISEFRGSLGGAGALVQQHNAAGGSPAAGGSATRRTACANDGTARPSGFNGRDFGRNSGTTGDRCRGARATAGTAGRAVKQDGNMETPLAVILSRVRSPRRPRRSG